MLQAGYMQYLAHGGREFHIRVGFYIRISFISGQVPYQGIALAMPHALEIEMPL